MQQLPIAVWFLLINDFKYHQQTQCFKNYIYYRYNYVHCVNMAKILPHDDLTETGVTYRQSRFYHSEAGNNPNLQPVACSNRLLPVTILSTRCNPMQ